MTQYMIAWNPKGSGRSPGCRVGPHPDLTNWEAPYEMTTGCCYSGFPPADRGEHERWLLAQALVLVIQGVALHEILNEFSKIDVWRQMRTPNYASLESLGRIAQGKSPDTLQMPSGTEYDRIQLDLSRHLMGES